MSLVLPVMYHWSPEDRRSKIARRGLKATCPTITEVFDTQPVGPRRLGASIGHKTVKAVCLGTTPSHAWGLCGAIWGQRGETWDLWQVCLDEDDTVEILSSEIGHRLGEIRVCNDIPKSRAWLVGSRTIGSRKWSVE